MDIPEESTTLREVVGAARRRHGERKKVQGRADRRPQRRTSVRRAATCRCIFSSSSPYGIRRGDSVITVLDEGPLHGGRRLPLHAVYADGVLRQVRFLPRGHQAHERAFVGAAQLPAERGGLLPAHGPRRDDLRHRLLQPRARLVLDAAKRREILPRGVSQPSGRSLRAVRKRPPLSHPAGRSALQPHLSGRDPPSAAGAASARATAMRTPSPASSARRFRSTRKSA